MRRSLTSGTGTAGVTSVSGASDGAESVDTTAVVAGFAGGQSATRPPRRRLDLPERPAQPSRPNATTCCCLDSCKRLLMAVNDPAGSYCRQRLRSRAVVAGFQVSAGGRIWVSTEERVRSMSIRDDGGARSRD